MSKAKFPLPADANRAKLLLDYIKYGIIVVKISENDARTEVTFYIKSPERIFMKDENGDPFDSRELVMEFKRKLQEVEGNERVIIKRAPYKNIFDSWTDSDSEQAYEEYKLYLMLVYEESELI